MYDRNHNLIILKTNIASIQKVIEVSSIFNKHPRIIKWSVDIEDIDNVLRIEASPFTKEKEIKNLVLEHGFYCEDLV